jgi:hypothetical protein
MRFSFEPGDGSIEIILQPGEILPEELDGPDVTVLEERSPNSFFLVYDPRKIFYRSPNRRSRESAS